MTVTFVNCLFCGDPCWVTTNGAYCGDCNVYAYLPDERSRWKVYIPCWMVPSQEVSNDDGNPCGQGCEYICRCY